MLTLSERTGPLRGEITVPGDKSISHRAVMFGALAEGRTEIDGFLSGADCLATVDCFRRLGIKIDVDTLKGRVTVKGDGMRGLHPAGDPVELYTANSGTTTRIISGILAPQPFTTILSGDDSIARRPMKRIMTPLRLMGADITSVKGNDCAPLRIRGTKLHGITYKSPVASAQVKSSILCAGLYAEAPTEVIEPSLSRDHTERMLSAFGARVESFSGEDGCHARIQPCTQLYGQKILVPGDISSAAYFIAAGLIVPGSEILIRNAGINPTRAGILKAALQMGADITLCDRHEGAEPTADLLIRYSHLHGTTISGAMIPTLIDEIPALAVMAAAAEGTTVIKDAAELKVKETNRIDTITENLRAMGGNVTPVDDGLIIQGNPAADGRPVFRGGATIHTHADHRIAMAFAIAALIADGDTFIDDEQCAAVSYPTFFTDLAAL